MTEIIRDPMDEVLKQKIVAQDSEQGPEIYKEFVSFLRNSHLLPYGLQVIPAVFAHFVTDLPDEEWKKKVEEYGKHAYNDLKLSPETLSKLRETAK